MEKNSDHLQFLVTVLRGHWGKNSLDVIKEWATFHLMEMMSDLQLRLAFAELLITSKSLSQHKQLSKKYNDLLNNKLENFKEFFDMYSSIKL